MGADGAALTPRGSITGPGFTLAALRQLGLSLEDGEDIDSFIANLTIPPPPEGSDVSYLKDAVQWSCEWADGFELTGECQLS